MRTSTTMTHLIHAITAKHAIDLARPGAGLILIHPDHAGHLSIKRAGPNQVTVSRRPEPKLPVNDPEVTLFTGPPYAEEWAPVEFIAPSLGFQMMTVTLSPDGSTVTRVRSANQAEITRQTDDFAAELSAQNWLDQGEKQAENS